MQVNYLELPAMDFDAIEAFYTKIFHWIFTDYGPEYRAFNDGQLDGGFYRSERQSNPENGATLIVFLSDELEVIQDKIIKAGGSIVKDIFEFPGGRRFQFMDPHGNELAVWSKT